MLRNLGLASGSILAILSLSSCDEIKEALEDASGECLEVCSRIAECEGDVHPPQPDLGGFLGSDDIELPSVAACATNCVDATNREFNGYSDCQIECIVGVGECGDIDACWSVSSDTYAEYCLADRELDPVSDEDGDEPDNGTTSGSSGADMVVTNPAVEASVEGSGTVVHFGDSPPPGIAGLWHAEGQIDSQSNARAVGSPINTNLCFFDLVSTDEGPEISYCEKGVTDSGGDPLTDTAPITGDEDGGWTIYLEFEGVGSIIFSGVLEESATDMENVDALVTYYHGIDIWEHSTTKWDTEGEACSISDCY